MKNKKITQVLLGKFMKMVREEKIDRDLFAAFLADPKKHSANAQAVLERSVNTLKLSSRTQNVLFCGGIRTLGQLVPLKKWDLLAVKNCGPLSLKEIERKLKKLDLSLAKE